MKNKKLIISILMFILSILVLLKPSAASGTNASDYPETVSALRELYEDEIIAHRIYSAFVEKAMEEKYYSVARLFRALMESESVHARNFESILREKGVTIAEFSEPAINVSTTKKNLSFALDVELSEIDSKYPDLISEIKPEGNERALADITYAWKSEMQHRDLLKKMKSSIRFFFGKIVEKLRKADKYHVCQRCGSTVFRLPDKYCGICSSPVSLYKEIR